MDITIIKEFFENNGKVNHLKNLSNPAKEMMIEYAKTTNSNMSKLILTEYKIEYKETKKNTKTQHFKSLLDEKTATHYYNLFKDGIDFDKGIKDKYNKETRPAKDLETLYEDDPIVKPLENLIFDVLGKIKFGNSIITKSDKTINRFIIVGQYMNYYPNGNSYAPIHSHPGLVQVIISFGTTRKLQIGKKTYLSSNGDVFVFGSSPHGIIKEPDVKDGRISIALFCKLV
jgi:hypothetical protein